MANAVAPTIRLTIRFIRSDHPLMIHPLFHKYPHHLCYNQTRHSLIKTTRMVNQPKEVPGPGPQPTHQPSDEAEQFFAQGNDYAMSCRYEEAIASYNRALDIKPDYHEAWFMRGFALGSLDKYEEAIASYDHALQIKPDDHVAWYDRGFALRKLGRNEEAIASYESALQIKPDNHVAWLNGGIALVNVGRYEEAIVAFDRALELKPDYRVAWYNRALILPKLGRYDYAIRDYERTMKVERDKKHEKMFYNHGVALGNLGRYEDAVEYYDRTIKIKPDHHQALFNRGNALVNLGRNEAAIQSYDRALDIKRDYHDASFNRGVALANLGRNEEAITSYDRALNFQPDYHEAWNNRGVALANLGRNEEAITSYDRALEIKLDAHIAWLNRGVALVNLVRNEEAITSYDRALKINPDDHVAWSNCGIALGNLGRHEDAVASFARALDINPHDHVAWLNGGIALGNLGRYEDAIAFFEGALEIKPDYHVAWYCRGVTFFYLCRYEEAIESYDSAIHIKLDLHKAWLNRGIAASNLSHPLPDFYTRIVDKQRELTTPGYQGELLCYEIGLIYVHYPEGRGELHREIGRAHYRYSRRVSAPDPDKLNRRARKSYDEALKYLTPEDFPELHLETLIDVIRVLSSLGEDEGAKKVLLEGSQLLEKLLANPKSLDEKERLYKKFYFTFSEETVNLLLREGKTIEAWNKAEWSKNAGLTWLLSSFNDNFVSAKTNDIRKLLNPQTAIIYWHVSPNRVATFILRSDSSSAYQPHVMENTGLQQAIDIENFLKEWQKEYLQYAKKTENKDQPNTDQDEPNWEETLADQLEKLGKILAINDIIEYLTGIKQLILIPHKELHLLPLEALFPDDFHPIRLPSVQTGIGLKSHAANLETKATDLILLSIQNPEHTGEKLHRLSTADAEAELVRQLLPNHIILSEDNHNPNKPTLANVKKQIKQLSQTKKPIILHFTGHGDYNFNQPADSRIFLKEKDTLTAQQITKLDLSNYQLISLSACETAISTNQSITIEYVGLASACLRAKAQLVLGTLWTVESGPTMILSIEFYRRYVVAGKPGPIALVESKQWLKNATISDLRAWYQAELDELEKRENLSGSKSNFLRRFFKGSLDNLANLSANPPYSKPHHWASFTLTGL